MAKQVKPRTRTRAIDKRDGKQGLTIRSIVDSEGYVAHQVQGWKEGGKWMRRRFNDLAKAERFVALKRVEIENQGRAQRMILTPLTDKQAEEAVLCFDKLGSAWALTDAVEFFLRHHRPPEFQIRLSGAVKGYLDAKERDGLRKRTLRALKGSLGAFARATGDAWTHEVTEQAVRAFLDGLRGKDGSKATRKTWNNYRADLHAFFSWAAEADLATNRPFTFENPVASVTPFDVRKVREQQNETPITTCPRKVRRMFKALEGWKGGKLVRYWALAYFAGIRPEELLRLSENLINTKTRTITIPANVSKTRHERKVTISENLAAWLEATKGKPIVPVNFRRLNAEARRKLRLTHDEARHSFISYHVAAYRSLGDAALQAGNSESIVKRHYLNLHPKEAGEAFFRVGPIGWVPTSEQVSHLRAV